MGLSRRFAPPRHASPPGGRSGPAVVCGPLLGLWLLLTPAAVHAEAVSAKDPVYRRLAGPMSSVVEGQPWREALRQIADRAGMNLWVDRRVDPTRPVDSGQIGPTVWDCLRQLARERQCEVMPVAGVVLIGRPDWLDRTAAAVWRLEQAAPPNDQAASRGEKVDIAWPKLTTPREALRIASGGQAAGAAAALPHDLWPAVRWRSIDRPTAVALVLAQFDLQPRGADSLGSLAAVPGEASRKFTRRYSAGRADAAAIRRAVRQSDPGGRVARRGAWLEVTAEPAAHRAATAAWIAGQAENAAPPTDRPDAPRFDLKLKNKPAGEAFAQFAATAGKSLRVDPAARRACEQLVSLQAENATLAELAQQVAEQAGVQVDWGEDTVAVRAAP